MVMMPNGAAACRAAQKAAMAGILYDKQTNPELGEVLQKLQGAEASSDFDPFQRAVIREARRWAPLSALQYWFEPTYYVHVAIKAARYASMHDEIYGFITGTGYGL